MLLYESILVYVWVSVLLLSLIHIQSINFAVSILYNSFYFPCYHYLECFMLLTCVFNVHQGSHRVIYFTNPAANHQIYLFLHQVSDRSSSTSSAVLQYTILHHYTGSPQAHIVYIYNIFVLICHYLPILILYLASLLMYLFIIIYRFFYAPLISQKYIYFVAFIAQLISLLLVSLVISFLIPISQIIL